MSLNVSSKLMKLISDREKEIFHLVNCVIVTNALSLFGVVTNVINMVVFYKQGFTSTMNISFFGLAISDFCSLVMLLLYCVWVNPFFANSDVPMVSYEMLYLTAGQPHICFARITGWITVYITAERCLCIMIPLKVKQIITPKRTTLTLCIICTVIISSFLPEYATTYMDWNFYPDRNMTLFGLAFTSSRKSSEGLVYIMYSVLGFTSFVPVVVFTAILVIQLKQKSRWRMKANVEKSTAESISSRERKTVIMVVMITTVLIVCYIPGVTVAIVTFLEPQFSIIGQFSNTFLLLWACVFIFDAINSSVNIFLYYRMSSKYRETFNQIFGINETINKFQEESK